MSLRTATVALLFSLLSGLSPAATAQVYKWVDENGVVNYGDKPPTRNRAAHPLAENGGSVSVVPGIPKDELDRMQQQSMQHRVRQLELEVDELRARGGARDNAVPYSVPADVPVYTYGYGYGYPYPRRPLHPPVAERPGPRPEHPIANSRPRPVRSSPMELMPSVPAPRGAAGRG